jgi:ABC-2 type transport system ATP-binding protein
VIDALKFEGVVKTYGWRRRKALDNLSFRCPRGAIVGLVGPNGAGKTTAFSIAAGFLRPEAGRVEILGLEGFDPVRLKGRMGVLPQDAELPDRHSPFELLEHLARLQGLSDRREVERVIGAVRLSERQYDRIASLSHGMRRRVAVASALLGSPPLILLDEPMSGLDPVQAHALRDVLVGLRGRTTLVVSSHDLHELERISDHVVMIAAGRCVREGPIAEVTGRSRVAEWTLGAPVPLAALKAAVDQELSADGNVLIQAAASEKELDRGSIAILAVLAVERIPVREVRRGVGLERRFLADSA